MISFLFLTYNRLGVTARCFKSLAPVLARPDVEWLILDNASTDGTADWVLKLSRRYPTKIHPYLYARNTGVAGGRDILLHEAHGDILIIMDNDVEAVAPGWLDRLLQPLTQPDVWACGPGGHWLHPSWTYYDPAPRAYNGPVDVLSGFCQAWKRHALDAGVQMDLTYNPRWHEDSDMCLQARALGGVIWHTGAVGLHHVFSVTGDDGSSGWKQEYLAAKWRGKGLVRCEQEAVV